MPALVFAEELTAVSRAPHSLPAAKTTCCMRVSLLSSAYSWLGANGSAKPLRKVPQALLFRQSARGVAPTFCSERAGTTQKPTVSTLWASVIDGFLLPSELVFVSDHTSSWCELLGPTATPLPCASSAALELRKYSVPPFAVELRPAGAVAGQIVKPEFPLSIPWVSI